jgi:hypothetical protein
VPEDAEQKRFFVRRALGAMGLATEQDVNKYITTGGRLGAHLADMEKTGEVLKVQIEGLPKPHYMLAELASELRRAPGPDDEARLLSPFDNLVILRDRTKALFGFDYAMECYTPAAKRKYGYFSLPILWRGRLVGRLDPKADREGGTLMVNSLHLERPMHETAFWKSLAAELQRYARFNGCSKLSAAGKVSGDLAMLAKYI